MATLTSTKIKNTYDALLKATDNDAIGSSAKQITDGLGNGTPLYISTTQIGIGVTPEATYDLHVYSNAKVGGNLTVTGDLTVDGTVTTVSSETLTVTDPLIELAKDNTSSDALDIGFYGKYAPSGTTLYAGLFRDTGDSKFKLFRNLQEQPTTTVNTSGTGYTVATLVADVEGTLTGTIASSTVATTQSAGDNSTKVATTAYVDTTAGNYLPLAGGTMSGNIAMGSNNISGGGTFTATTFSGQLDGTISSTTTATTQTQGDNSTKVATTAYVDSAIGGQDTLAEVLAIGNTTGGTDIEVSSGDNIDFADGSIARFGASNDLQVYHDGSNSLILNDTGKLIIRNRADDQDIQFDCDNGSGGVETYFYLDGSAVNTRFPKDIKLNDSTKAIFGGGGDLEIYHDGSNSYIKDAGTGSLIIEGDTSTQIKGGTYVILRSLTNENMLVGNANGSVDIYYDNSKKLETTSTGITVTGGISTSNSITLSNPTDKYIRFIDTYGNWDIEVGDGANNFKIHSGSLNADYLTLEGGGQLNLGEYGSGSFTGTATYRLAVDSSGDVIEIPIGGGAVDGSGTANTVTMWSDTDTITDAPITISGNNATFAGNVTTGGQVTVPSGYSVNIGTSRIHSTSTSYLLGGNVGIGTSSPQRKLHLHESSSSGSFIAFTNDTTGQTSTDGAIVGIDGGEDMLISTYENKNIEFRTGNAERMRITSGGSVGIGTSSPDTKLQVYGTSAVPSVSTTFQGGIFSIEGSSTVYLDMGTTGSPDYYAWMQAHDAGTGVNYKLAINPLGGNVGIGTSSPFAKLHVENGSSGAGSAWTNADELIIENSGNVGLTLQSPNTAAATIAFQDPQSVQAGWIQYLHADNAMRFATNGNFERMRIDSSGRVGINETSLTEKLEVNGAIVWKGALTTSKTSAGVLDRSGNDLRIRAYGATSGTGNLVFRTGGGGGSVDSEAMRIASNGNVGIGTTATSLARLNVYDTTAGQGASRVVDISNSLDANINIWLSQSGASTKYAEIASYSTIPLVLNNTSGGNIGIGTTSPSQKLHVIGNIYSVNSGTDGGQIRLANSGGGSNWYWAARTNGLNLGELGAADGRIFIANGGNVGIGTTSPLAGLQVVDNEVFITGGTTTTGPGIFLGDNNFNNSNYYNSAPGIGAVGPYGGVTAGLAFYYYGGAQNSRNEAMRIDSSGRVGIGTTSPSSKLDVFGSGNYEGISVSNGNSSLGGGFVSLKQNGTSSGFIGVSGAAEGNNTNDIGILAETGRNIRFYTNGSASEKMRIDTNGVLQLTETSASGFVNANGTSLELDINRNPETGTFGDTNKSHARINLTGANGGSYIIFNTASANNTTATEKMRIDSSGNVGIATTGNHFGEKLRVQGWITSGSDSIVALMGENGTGAVMGAYSNHPLILRTNNTERMRIDSSGNVGLFGQTSPTSYSGYGVLHLGTSSTKGLVKFGNGNTWNGPEIYALYTGGASNLRFNTNSTVNVLNLVGSNVGIGITSPAHKLDVAGSGKFQPAIGDGDALVTIAQTNSNAYVHAGLKINAGNTNPFYIYQSGSSNTLRFNYNSLSDAGGQMVITSGGSVGIGETNPTYRLNVKSSNNLMHVQDTSGTSSATFVLFSAPSYTPIGGIYRNGSAGSIVYSTSSDYRLKEDLQDFNALDLVDNITAYDYKWKDTEQRDYGFVAHELQEVMPNVVTGEKDGEMMQGVDYAKLTPVLLKAIQELKAEIETLKAQINN